ncbi:hypothetical protein pgond44_14898 [Psychroflexus gondwanensis ACAM 44]|uniref:Uncharacterized protein n=1 Tax=Psychroflexus gondwanensis ACAM 44 TaxID=1189619 RepID=N1WHU2_9FLAO|nr:hypothetical protein [Psychroflexus gondwanensis]EMY79841.1 hypothetical protein pgond44_14898 [Psychroflexus gondwanensis ACAM 44]
MNKILLFFSISVLFCINVNGQKNQNDIDDKLKENLEVPREIAYLHLNKSTYLKGEQIAFSAYVLNKYNLKASKETTNLYVQIKDADEKVIKEKLLLVQDGVSSNTIRVDSLFTSGNYTISAFTNWMRNFEEQNYFVENIKVIEFDDNEEGYVDKNSNDLDIQFLPESGHLLNGVLNTVGVIAKKESGLGIANADLRIIDDQNKELARFRLNDFGIGKFSFIPKIGTIYKAEISYDGVPSRVLTMGIPIEKNGIILSAVTTQDELRLLVKTNRESAKTFKNKSFSLIHHTLKGSRVYDLNFEKNLSNSFLFNLKEFKPGMNILTLVDPDKKVIAERIFFNYNNLPITTFSSPKIKASLDSLEIQMKPKMALDSIKVSVSVLPKNSIANQHNHSITSYLLLQPYIRGVVQQADWYFNAIDKHKIQELDKLLITQGWSAYDWGSIFNSDFEIRYKSENLLEFEATLNKPTGENQEFLIHASNSSSPQVVKIPANKKSFIINNFFHFEDDELAISKMQGNQLLPANLYLRFSPNTYPDFKTNAPFVQPKVEKTSLNYTQDQPQVLFGKDREVLDEVVLEKRVDKVKERERELGAEKWGRVSVLDYDDITLFRTLARYLDSKVGISANENGGDLLVELRFQNSLGTPAGLEGGGPGGPANSKGMQLYLDDVPVPTSFFAFYPLDNVDYVEINRRAFGGGFLDVNGSVRVYSRFTSVFDSSKTGNPQKFNYPVAFSQQKQYYVPKSESYTSDFYQNYGVVDWKPLLKLNAAGEISFKIKKPQVDYQLIIQGISSNGTLIQDVQQINVEK